MSALSVAKQALSNIPSLHGVRAESPGAVLAAVPECAKLCTINGVVSAGCNLDDLKHISDCICTNATILSNISTCVQMACTYEEQVATREIEAVTVCNGYPKQSRSAEVRRVAIAALALTIPVVSLRVWSRLATVRRLWWDDWITLVSLVVLVVLCSMAIYCAHIGFGTHLWDIEPQRARLLLKLFWLVEVGYLLNLTLIKASIMLLFGRIFDTPGWQRLTKCSMVFFVTKFTAFVFPLLFQCTPVESVWDRTVSGSCINVTSIAYVGAAISITEDLIILVLPIRTLWRLQISHTRRLVIAGMFSIGSFACVTSMVRVKYLVHFSTTYDTTWTNTDVTIWSMIELLSAVVCGSIPPCRPLVSRLLSSKSIPERSSYAVMSSDQPAPQGTDGSHVELVWVQSATNEGFPSEIKK